MGEDFEFIDGGKTLVKADALTREGKYKSAMGLFDSEPLYMKYPILISDYALCVASVERDFDEARDLCLNALKRDVYNADIYLNLGKIFYMARKKALAMRAFKKGLKLDDTHIDLLAEARALGLRKRPVFKTFDRDSWLNKYAGFVRFKLSHAK